MAATRKKHPALPDEPGWYLFRIGIAAPPAKQGKWRAGYNRQGAEFRTSSLFDTEQQAIDWVWEEYKAQNRAAQQSDIVQRFLCSAWVAA